MTETNSVSPELTRSSILKGKKALIVGVANGRSIAGDAPRRCTSPAPKSR
jgi:hypothetical protein